ncbi:DNA cytosine methyltransferase [Shinella zoogloeoides]|uniref:DNA cytosine methyltransferase n=1 Tax=Shinella zoogloeoides TaxID=352475 RepID=UPI000E6468EF|nr:DNA (cytosine-5-)-methyltransferase [Shinella zoogloeoides]
MRAIDLYAGIGGWGLGLRLAGADLVASYERWKPAIDTHNGNLGGDIEPVDIRKLDLSSLPQDIDLVVGSPPCTEFSYANRGGSGNIAEGLKDLVKFFEVVDYLKPKFWAMENVPRVAEVLRHGFSTSDHALYRFRHFNPEIAIIDFSEFGTPQARRRCIATNIPLKYLLAYRERVDGRTLGDVISATSSNGNVIDPVWGVSIAAEKLTETEAEAPLNSEELRMNREAKEFHPVYNNMAFPDPMDEAARTVTATCTRVSRESIVIRDPNAREQFRRLTIRERASLQGFPITYQFYARSFSEKAKMIGNAIPPTFTYLLALVAQGQKAEDFHGFKAAAGDLALPAKPAPKTSPDGEGKTYPLSRSFRAAIPGLRFKSGMRFELANITSGKTAEWRMRFFFGPSKDIREIELLGEVTEEIQHNPLFSSVLNDFKGELTKIAQFLAGTTPTKLQLAWAHKVDGINPYEVVDRLGSLASDLHDRLTARLDADDLPTVGAYILSVASGSNPSARAVGQSKLERYALPILAGLVIGEWFNSLVWHCEQKAAA